MPQVEQTQAPRTSDDPRLAIVEAAALLLHEHGMAAVTTRAVAQAAGVQAPTIYRLFGDKDGLVDAVAEQVMATYVTAKATPRSTAATEPDPVEDVRAGWRMHVEFGLANPELYALLSAPGRATSPAVAAGVDVLRARVRRLAMTGLLRVDEARALALIHAAGTGTVLALLQTPVAERDLRLCDDMLGAVLDRILTDAPTAPDATMTALAVTFATVVPDLPGLSDAERGLMAEWLARSLVRLQSP